MVCNLEHSEPFPFRWLSTELRLRVLEHTHLGPHGPGGYDARFEQLLIRNGKLLAGGSYSYYFEGCESFSEWFVPSSVLFYLGKRHGLVNENLAHIFTAAPVRLEEVVDLVPHAVLVASVVSCPQLCSLLTVKCTMKQQSKSSTPTPGSVSSQMTSALRCPS